MLKDLLEFGKSIIGLVEKTNRHEKEIERLHDDLRRLSLRVDQLAGAIREIAYQLQRDRENAVKDQEIQRLRIETTLLRFERRLPPSTQPEEPPGSP